ncbi:MAG: alpha/beta hydrolase [Actinomycetota bacterium]|nr:alpha/beta hydrolase [Actinomycetota bacterium]
MATILLVHGGLWEPDMDAARFWGETGVLEGLRTRGHAVIAPDRPPRPATWDDDLAPVLTAVPVGAAMPADGLVVVAGSNGVTSGVRLACARPDAVRALVLLHPATAGDPRADEHQRGVMVELGASVDVCDALLAGGVLRGVPDDELAALAMPVAVVPALADDPFHLRSTVDALLALVPGARELATMPPPPMPTFAEHREAFLDAIDELTAVDAVARARPVDTA